jgi:hypothetical protein
LCLSHRKQNATIASVLTRFERNSTAPEVSKSCWGARSDHKHCQQNEEIITRMEKAEENDFLAFISG